MAKRFCCRHSNDLIGGDNVGGFMLKGWGNVLMKGGEESCQGWKNWGQVWEEWNGTTLKEGSGKWFEYLAYVLLAVSPLSWL